jgi:hypothetical protein
LAPPLATKNLIDPSIEVLRATLFVLRPHKLLNRGSQAVCASGFDRQIIAAEHTRISRLDGGKIDRTPSENDVSNMSKFGCILDTSKLNVSKFKCILNCNVGESCGFRKLYLLMT